MAVDDILDRERVLGRKLIQGRELLGFEIAMDGSRFRMTFKQEDGGVGAIDLPAECLNALVMTLPRMVTQALRAKHHDDTLRLVYPAEVVRLEQASDPATVILTLATPDGFEVSFGLNDAQMQALEGARENRDRQHPQKRVFS